MYIDVVDSTYHLPVGYIVDFLTFWLLGTIYYNVLIMCNRKSLPVELFHIGFIKLEGKNKKNISDDNINKINFTKL